MFHQRFASWLLLTFISAGLFAGCSDPGGVVPTPPPTAVPTPRPTAVVAGTLEVTQSGTEPDQVFYVFALKLTESAGVPATITALWINFDGVYGPQCIWTDDKLGQTRLPANGTLALDPLTCDYYHQKAPELDVYVNLTDDNGYLRTVIVHREL